MRAKKRAWKCHNLEICILHISEYSHVVVFHARLAMIEIMRTQNRGGQWSFQLLPLVSSCSRFDGHVFVQGDLYLKNTPDR